MPTATQIALGAGLPARRCWVSSGPAVDSGWVLRRGVGPTAGVFCRGRGLLAESVGSEVGAQPGTWSDLKR